MVAVMLALVGCSNDVPFEALSPSQQLTRASLDLRGVRPTLDELDQVLADPEALEPLMHGFLEDPRVSTRVREGWKDILLTASTASPIEAYTFKPYRNQYEGFLAVVGEEPARIMERIFVEDRPVREIVTGDWTMANPMVDRLFPLDREEGDGWTVAHYTDGRPPAGLLSTNGLWWRYETTSSNQNRKRANQISRILLCHDYLDTPVPFTNSDTLPDEAAIRNALTVDPTCRSCHDTLDPLASFLNGFDPLVQGGLEVTTYHPERERWYLDAEPSYFGQPGESLGDLGQLIADDPRFLSCMAEHTLEMALQRDVQSADDLASVHEVLASGGTLKQALFTAMRTPSWQAASDVPGADAAPRRLIPVDTLGSAVAELTGFQFTIDGEDMLGASDAAFRSLAGGVDGVSSIDRPLAPSPAMLLVVERLAESAATHLVLDPDGGRLDDGIDLSAPPNTAAIQTIMRRVLSRAATAEEVRDLADLWAAVDAVEEEPELAWAAVLTAVLRDPDFLLY